MASYHSLVYTFKRFKFIGIVLFGRWWHQRDLRHTERRRRQMTSTLECSTLDCYWCFVEKLCVNSTVFIRYCPRWPECDFGSYGEPQTQSNVIKMTSYSRSIAVIVDFYTAVKTDRKLNHHSVGGALVTIQAWFGCPECIKYFYSTTNRVHAHNFSVSHRTFSHALNA